MTLRTYINTYIHLVVYMYMYVVAGFWRRYRCVTYASHFGAFGGLTVRTAERLPSTEKSCFVFVNFQSEILSRKFRKG